MLIRKIKVKIKQKLKKILDPLLKRMTQLANKQNITDSILTNLSHQTLKRRYKQGEKVNIVFIFQAASFWPSWESVWNAVCEDERFNPTMLVCDVGLREKVQFLTAKSFLDKKGIKYKDVFDVNIEDFKPHIVVLHTPYDGHRPRYLHSKMLSSKGYRVVYITYGIEIADTKKARDDHFTTGVPTNCWRLYTFSKDMIRDYKLYSPVGGEMVRSFGHPKFDYLSKEFFPSLPKDILEKAGDRKVILWKVHFPKEVNGEIITPSLDMYMEFLSSLEDYSDNIFFIFMPHPKFYEQLENFMSVDEFKNKVDATKNLIEYTDDDYRPVIVNCDYYIVDRSALMIEAGISKKPILYVSAKKQEQMTEPIQKIVDSYYQANKYEDIKSFIDEVVLKDNDYKKDERLETINSVLPKIDGKSGYKIKEDMINSLLEEDEK